MIDAAGAGPRIRITEERQVYENAYGRLYDDSVIFEPKGATGTYVRWQWNAPYSVAVLPLFGTRQGLLLRSFRHSAREVVTEVVMGFGVEGVEPAEAALMELREETGLVATRASLEPLGVIYTDLAFAALPAYCFLAWLPESDGPAVEGTRPEFSESIHGTVLVGLSPPDRPLPEDVRDATTLLMLHQARDRIRGGGRPHDRSGCTDLPDGG